MRMEHAWGGGARRHRCRNLPRHVRINWVFTLADDSVGVVRGAERRPKRAAVAHEKHQRVVTSYPGHGFDQRSARCDVVVPPKAQWGDDIETLRREGSAHLIGETRPRGGHVGRETDWKFGTSSLSFNNASPNALSASFNAYSSSTPPLSPGATRTATTFSKLSKNQEGIVKVRKGS